jgi:hypothetical protein
VDEAARSPFAAWDTFYVIVGSSSAALTGLQFVVMTLIGEMRPSSTAGLEDAVGAFSTPTVVHFSAVLFVSALLSAPWSALWPVGSLLAAGGAAGVVYEAIVVRRTRRQSEYRPVLEDWLFHVIFPLVAYAGALVASVMLGGRPHEALFVLAFATLVLMFTGIHNAWDTVSYVTIQRRQQSTGSEPPSTAQSG